LSQSPKGTRKCRWGWGGGGRGDLVSTLKTAGVKKKVLFRGGGGEKWPRGRSNKKLGKKLTPPKSQTHVGGGDASLKRKRPR